MDLSVQQGAGSRGTLIAIDGAVVLTFALVVVGVFGAAVPDTGDGFVPRVPTIDALGGLVTAAFLVDRLVTFVPAWLADGKNAQRQSDIAALRWGWGALIGGGFVLVTGLRGVDALCATTINVHVDRAITVLAIAGGVKGLSQIKDALNPPKDKQAAAVSPDGDATEVPAPSVYVAGLLLLGLAALIAAIFHGDRGGINLLSEDKGDDGTIALIVHFGPVLLAAVAIQQLVERTFASSITGPGKKVLVGGVTVVLGVIAARAMDLYFLHNLGFFGTTGTDATSLNRALGASTGVERLFDVWATGLVIAAGTAPIHDLSEALKRPKAT